MRISSVIVICDTGINTPINGDGAFGLNRAGNKKEEIISEYLNVFILITFIRGANMRPEP